jgi:hypothetical protein
MTPQSNIGYALPALIFPILTAFAMKTIFVHFKDPVVTEGLSKHCIPNQGLPLAISYTGIGPIDKTLCALNGFFLEAFEPRNETFTTYLVVAVAPIALFMFVEAARKNRPWILSAPMAVLFGLGYQRLTCAVVSPLYWLTFITSDAPKPAPSGKVDLRYARSIIFAALVGYLIPSLGMVGTHGPIWSAIWQAFPLTIWLAQRAYLLLQPTSGSGLSGTEALQSLYLGVGAICALFHLAVVLPNLGELWELFQLGQLMNVAHTTALHRIFVPHFFVPGEPTNAADAALNFLQWDFVLVGSAVALATLWFARNAREVLMLVGWNLVVGMVLGPSAALAGVYAWREGIEG